MVFHLFESAKHRRKCLKFSTKCLISEMSNLSLLEIKANFLKVEAKLQHNLCFFPKAINMTLATKSSTKNRRSKFWHDHKLEPRTHLVLPKSSIYRTAQRIRREWDLQRVNVCSLILCMRRGCFRHLNS